MLVTAMVMAVDAHARPTSIMASAYATAPASAPPSAAGTFTPIMPSSASSRRISGGISFVAIDGRGGLGDDAGSVVAGGV